MLEFLTDYGFQLLAGILGGAGAAGGITALVYTVKLAKKAKKERQLTEKDIQVTREGIVEAFKTATLPDEVKVSINTKVEEMLGNFRDDFIKTMKENLELTQRMQVATLKILSFTAASSKLSEEDKAELQKISNIIAGNETPEIDTTK